jgi:hypothetical protein
MPGCVFHARGEEFAVDEFLAGSSLAPYRIYHRGELAERCGRVWKDSGFSVNVTDDGESLSGQCEKVISFLREFEGELIRLAHFHGVTDRRLDFGYYRRDVVVQFDYLPPRLLALAGSLGIGIELSLYPIPAAETE